MEVTRSNFKTVLDLVKSAISGCSFLAIDGEFTGLNTWSADHPYDTPSQRYLKLKQCCQDFLLIQFGLCAFQWNPKSLKYIAKPFNFYLFPSVSNRHVPDVRFLCQSSSVDFLVSQGFDFNKLFREGIPYLRPFDEQKLRDALDIKDGQTSFSSPAFFSPADPKLVKVPATIEVPPDQQEFVDQICNTVEDLIQSDRKREDLPVCNGFQRKLIHQSIKKKFPGCGLHVETLANEKKQRYIVVTKLDEGEKDKKLEEQQAKHQEQLQFCVGFTEVIRQVAQSGKIIVGHNMFLDLLHMVHQFVCPLPDSLEDFKGVVQCQFPYIVDTKTMASSQPFREKIPTTRLDELVLYLEAPPFKKPDVVFDDDFSLYSSGAAHYHEAGYDAYSTGLAFISMCNYLGSLHNPPIDHVTATSQLIEPYHNKLHLMRMEDVPYLSLSGPDLKPSRDHVFYIKFPITWTYSDLLQLFSPYGYVYVNFLNPTEAFISLTSRTNASKVLKGLGGKGDGYHIMSYCQYQQYVSAEEGLAENHGQKRKYSTSSENSDDSSDGDDAKQPCKKKASEREGPLEEGELPDSSDDEQVKKKIKSNTLESEHLFEEPSDW